MSSSVSRELTLDERIQAISEHFFGIDACFVSALSFASLSLNGQPLAASEMSPVQPCSYVASNEFRSGIACV